VVPTIERRDRAWRDDAARSVVDREPLGTAPMLLAVVPVVALGFAEGGFFPTSWAWAALGLAVAGAAALVLRRETLMARRTLVLLAALASLGVWIAASLAWTRSTGLSVLELQRLLLYAVGVGAAAVIVRRHGVRPLVTGVFLGTATLTCWGLVSYLVTRERTPDVLQGSYLHRPLGYANAMAIVCVIAIVLGLAIVGDSTSRRLRIATSTVLVPLASALALTGSRAAIGTLIVGVAVLAALEPNRRRLLATWRWIAVVPVGAALPCRGSSRRTRPSSAPRRTNSVTRCSPWSPS